MHESKMHVSTTPTNPTYIQSMMQMNKEKKNPAPQKNHRLKFEELVSSIRGKLGEQEGKQPLDLEHESCIPTPPSSTPSSSTSSMQTPEHTH
jgi:hypothetical protein